MKQANHMMKVITGKRAKEQASKEEAGDHLSPLSLAALEDQGKIHTHNFETNPILRLHFIKVL